MSADGFDGQFLAVTAAALWGVWLLLRPLLRWRGKPRPGSGSCGRCSSAACAKGSGRPELVSLGGGRNALPPAGKPREPR